MLDDLLVKGLRVEYQEAYDNYTANTEGILTEIDSTTQTENFAWLGAVPRMRVFDGERKPVQVGDYKFTIDNEEYEASMAIDQRDLDDDQTGKYKVLANSIGTSSAIFPEELLWGTVLPGGFTSLAYDGQYFFDTNHRVGLSGLQSNKITAKLGPTGFDAALDALYSFKDDQGRPITKQLDLVLVVPIALRATARNLLSVSRFANGQDNPYFQSAQIQVCPWLTDPNQWYIINKAGGSGVNAFVKLNRKYEPLAVLGQAPTDTAVVVNQSEAQFMRRKHYVGTYWRGAVGNGMFQKAVGSTGTTGTVGA